MQVTLPEKGLPRDRWVTRAEAARLILTCWRYRETQTIHRGERQGDKIEVPKWPLRHLARFLLIGLYTGTRASPILLASPIDAKGRSFVDLERGLFYRKPRVRAETNKRQPPVPLPRRLLTHMRRWHRLGIIKEYFVEFHGRPIKSVKTAMAHAVSLAGVPTELGNVTPHTFRHTRATWLMQSGAPLWEAAGYLGMSEKTLRENYGHHHPGFMQGALAAIDRKPQQLQSLVISLVEKNRNVKHLLKSLKRWWRTQSLSNQSLLRNSLLTGKRTGIFLILEHRSAETSPLLQ